MTKSNIVLSNILQNNAQQYSSTAFNLVMNIAQNVILPVAGVIFTYVVVTDLIQMQMSQNNMHEHTTWDLYKWIFKTAIGAVLIANSFTIANAIIEVGTEMVMKVTPITNIKEVTAGSFSVSSDLMEMELWELLALSFSMILNMAVHWVSRFLIQLFIVARFFEIYMYLMIAPIPFSTLTSQQLSQTGLNYIKNVIALAFQALIILVSFAIYTAVSASISLDTVVGGNLFDVGGALMEGLILLVVMVVMIWRSRSISQSLVGAG